MPEAVVRIFVFFAALRLALTTPCFGFAWAKNRAEQDIKLVKKRAEQDSKLVIRKYLLHERVGRDRLRGNLIDASGAAIGGILVFYGANLTNPALLAQSALVLDNALTPIKSDTKRYAACVALATALLRLPMATRVAPLLFIGGMNVRTCDCIINTMEEEHQKEYRIKKGRKAASQYTKTVLRDCAYPLAAMASITAAANITSVSASTLASSLLGGTLLVECCLDELRNELDKIFFVVLKPLIDNIFRVLKPLIDVSVRTFFQKLLPLQLLVKNELKVLKTVKQSSVALVESAFHRLSGFAKVVVVTGIGFATQVPIVSAAAKQVVAQAMDEQLESKLQGILPALLREINVTSRVRDTALRFPPFKYAVSMWHLTKTLLRKSARWVLPYFFAAWGCGVQSGRFRLIRDAPHVLLYLFPVKWGHVLPEPTHWLVKHTKTNYARYINHPMKFLVKGGALKLVHVVRNASSSRRSRREKKRPMIARFIKRLNFR